MFHTVRCLKHPKAVWNWGELLCRQITKEPKAESAGDAQRPVDARNNVVSASLTEAGALDGTTLSSHHANELTGSAASHPIASRQSHPGLHVANDYPHNGANKSRLASKPGLQSRAAQQVMQQRQDRLQQAAVDSSHAYMHQTSAM